MIAKSLNKLFISKFSLLKNSGLALKYSSRSLLFQKIKQKVLRIGSVAPDFEAESTQGKIKFHEYIGNRWTVFFSYPADFTPVCTTEVIGFSNQIEEFNSRDVKLLALSTESQESHLKWLDDFSSLKMNKKKPTFPIVSDVSQNITFLYNMCTEDDFQKIEKDKISAIRSVYIIDPEKKIRFMMFYPFSTGRNIEEILRVIDSLKLNDSKKVFTPVNWKIGEDVILPPSLSDEEAKKKFGFFKKLNSYLRTTKIS